tara:strand:+ start:2204 stop:2545 length:342 start_codon:yes stop_codon:yes gene_type:complete
MRNTTEYEWDIEMVDKHGDILDHDFSDKLQSLKIHSEYPHNWQDEKIVSRELTLVKSVGNEYQGVVERTWAYINTDGLPSEFENGDSVPKRFAAEFARNREWAMQFASDVTRS